MNALSALRRITLPVAAAEGCELTLSHALRMAVRNRARLDIIRIGGGSSAAPEVEASTAQSLLHRWGLSEDGGEVALDELGLELALHGPRAGDLGSLAAEVEAATPDLVVAWVDAPRAWGPTAAQRLARLQRVPTLFLAPGRRGWIDPRTGADRLRRVLVPVGGLTSSVDALLEVSALLPAMAEGPFEFHLVHVGDALEVGTVPSGLVPHPHDLILHAPSGETVLAIVGEARRLSVDLIAMCTQWTPAGQGLMGDVLGSRTERVVRKAPCPVLQIPLG